MPEKPPEKPQAPLSVDDFSSDKKKIEETKKNPYVSENSLPLPKYF